MGFRDEDKHSYNLIKLDHHQWWHSFRFSKSITREEASKRFMYLYLCMGAWCIAASLRGVPPVWIFENTHAFMEIAIPWGDGRYVIMISASLPANIQLAC